MSALSKLLLLAGFAAHAMAITIPVKVGEVGLTFEPNEIRAHKDDVIEFRFYALNHSVVAGNFDEACTPAEEGGFFSGFNFPTARTNPPTANPLVFRVTVTNTHPLPIYCSQNNGQHCKNGMVAVINPSGQRRSLAAYRSLLANAGNATSPLQGVFGGVIAQREDDGSASYSASTTTATATATVTTSAVLNQTVTTTTTTTTTSSTTAATVTQTGAAATSTTAAPASGAGRLAGVPLAGMLLAAAAAVVFV
ncbi:hypothetical protein N656DRAFT_716784 [Canariomyces notabilis]|uniref:Extracellular serine-rich protein n=1 Tax=Canariomyces notabilis TaxID=2074819 RepID=A0AAN6T9Q5_9PEZI|nr:hypothetical protein N656DRAFT_716784 [Canariomyces arenarius]